MGIKNRKYRSVIVLLCAALSLFIVSSFVPDVFAAEDTVSISTSPVIDGKVSVRIILHKTDLLSSTFTFNYDAAKLSYVSTDIDPKLGFSQNDDDPGGQYMLTSKDGSVTVSMYYINDSESVATHDDSSSVVLCTLNFTVRSLDSTGTDVSLKMHNEYTDSTVNVTADTKQLYSERIYPSSNASGTASDSVKWDYDDANATLIISGNSIASYPDGIAPWYRFHKYVKTLILKCDGTHIGGISSVGAGALCDLGNAQKMILGNKNTIFSNSSITGLNESCKVYVGGIESGEVPTVASSLKSNGINNYYPHDCAYPEQYSSDTDSHYQTCNVCGYRKCEAHTEDDGTIETGSTCSAQGSVAYHCTVCGELTRKIKTPVDTTAHAWGEWEVGKAASCTSDGIEKRVCANNASHIETRAIPAKGHTEQTVPGKAATCTEQGLTDGIKCSVCGEAIKQQEIIPANGHTEQSVPGKPATCTETGLTDGIVCAVCGETLKAQETIPAKGHTEETIPGKPATCTETGLTDGIKCSVCGVVIKAQQTVPAKGHTEQSIPGKPATCTETGLTDGIKCSVCGSTIKDQETIPAKGHSWNAGETVTEADCSHEGAVLFTCNNCNETRIETSPKDPAKHSSQRELKNAVAPTCTTSGYSGDTYCAGCGAKLGSGVKRNALGHNWSPWSTDENSKTKSRNCLRCGQTETIDESNSKSKDNNENDLREYLLGDVDKDGKITAADARLTLRIAVALEQTDDLGRLLSDADGDGNVTAADARLVLRVAVDLERFGEDKKIVKYAS